MHDLKPAVMCSPIISVIMLTYNREAMVGRAVDSVLSQTLGDFEFIIVDNGSTDKSGRIIDGYAMRDSRIKVIHKERGNIGSGRNAGLDAAQGEYITFIDDDDWVEAEYLEFLYALATDNCADVAICGRTNKHFDEKLLMDAETAVHVLLKRDRFTVGFPAKLLHREAVGGYRFSEGSRYDDIELMPKILAGAKRIAFHGLPKYVVCRHGSNNSAWAVNHQLMEPETLDEYLRVYSERTKWLCTRFPGSVPDWKYFEWSFMLSMTVKITQHDVAGCYRKRDLLVKELTAHKAEFLSNPLVKEFEKEWVEKYI